MSRDARQTIRDLHEIYVQQTGFEIRLDMAREHEWFTWLKRGFTADDLRVVIHHIRRGIRDGKRNDGALKFRNLICNADFFEEDLAEARCAQRVQARKPKMDAGRAEALRATGRPSAAPPPEAKQVREIVTPDSIQDFLKQLKEGTR